MPVGYLYIFLGEISKSLAYFLIGLFFGVIELSYQDFKTRFMPHTFHLLLYIYLFIWLYQLLAVAHGIFFLVVACRLLAGASQGAQW